MIGIGDITKVFGAESIGKAILHGGQSALKNITKDLLSGKASTSSAENVDIDSASEVEDIAKNQGVKSDSLDPSQPEVHEPTLDKANAPAIRIDGDDLVRSLTTLHTNIVNYLSTINKNNIQTFDYVKRKMANQDATFVSIKNTVSKFNQSISGIEARLGKLEGDVKNQQQAQKKVDDIRSTRDDDNNNQSQPVGEKDSVLGNLGKALTGVAALEVAPALAVIVGGIAIAAAVKDWNSPNSVLKPLIKDYVIPIAEEAAKKAASYIWNDIKTNSKFDPFGKDAVAARNAPWGINTLAKDAWGSVHFDPLGKAAVDARNRVGGLNWGVGAGDSSLPSKNQFGQEADHTGFFGKIKELWNGSGSGSNNAPMKGGMIAPLAMLFGRGGGSSGGGNSLKPNQRGGAVPDLINNNNFGPPDLARGQTLSPADLISMMSQITAGSQGVTKAELPGLLQMALGSSVRGRYGGGVGAYGGGSGARSQYGGGVGPYGGSNVTEGPGGLDRSRFATELQQKPWLRDKILAIAAGENRDPRANQAVLETMMNRAAMMGTSLEEEARLHRSEGGYYAGYNPNALNDPKYMAMANDNLNKVLGGSNVSNFATDNASNQPGNRLAETDVASGRFAEDNVINGEHFLHPIGQGARGAGQYGAFRSTADSQIAAHGGLFQQSDPRGSGGAGATGSYTTSPDAMKAVGGLDPKAFIFHHTGGRGSVSGVQDTLRQRGLGVEYVMDRDGNITQIGGPGSANILPGWGPKGKGLNNQNIIGMEVIAKDDKDVTPAQVAAAKAFIAKNYPNTPVFGHGEVNPGHKEADEGMTIVGSIRQQRAVGDAGSNEQATRAGFIRQAGTAWFENQGPHTDATQSWKQKENGSGITVPLSPDNAPSGYSQQTPTTPPGNVHGGLFQSGDYRAKPKQSGYRFIPGSQYDKMMKPDGTLLHWASTIKNNGGQAWYDALSPENKARFDAGKIDFTKITAEEFERLKKVDPNIGQTFRPIVGGAIGPVILPAMQGAMTAAQAAFEGWINNPWLQKSPNHQVQNRWDDPVFNPFVGGQYLNPPPQINAFDQAMGGGYYTGPQTTQAVPHTQSQKYWGATGKASSIPAGAARYPAVPYMNDQGGPSAGSPTPAKIIENTEHPGFGNYSHPDNSSVFPDPPNTKFFPMGGGTTGKATAPPFPHEEKQHQYDEARHSNSRPRVTIPASTFNNNPEQGQDEPGARGPGAQRDADHVGICSV